MNFLPENPYTRRAFLHRGLTLASASVTIPWFLHAGAAAIAAPDGAATKSRPGIPDDRILVVVQLAGGNDGLNTVIPFGDAEYYRARPGIGVMANQVLKLGKGQSADGIGLHPRLTGLKELYDEGALAIVQGVGYPNPNRSHFKSMDIWQTADTGGTGDGWLGRYFDNQCSGEPGGGCPGHAGIALGRAAPLAMQGHKYKPIAFETAELFRWSGLDLDDSMREPYSQIERGVETDSGNTGRDNAASFLMRTALDARIASERIRKAVDSTPLVQYPGNPLARQLAMVASMIRHGLETRVYYVSISGFDTHAGQGGAQGGHANLLGQVGDSLAAFSKDLKAQGNDGRVLTMTFSEFGRRVAQNGSGGTDHGTAAPMFIMGPMVRPGLTGRHPSLKDLDEGDLKFGTDFRSVYASILDDWMKTDARKVLGRPFPGTKLIKA
ncbi:MAG TPA: DUF1501 domain-containing protein [Phycisphaerales bacterium]|nr:DUF1501 domain-containing protein [Phycisphaerales bacterium]